MPYYKAILYNHITEENIFRKGRFANNFKLFPPTFFRKHIIHEYFRLSRRLGRKLVRHGN